MLILSPIIINLTKLQKLELIRFKITLSKLRHLMFFVKYKGLYSNFTAEKSSRVCLFSHPAVHL